jgi:FAD synthetase
MKTILIFGTFDFLHSGHLHAFQEAKKLGDRLVVSIARDVSVENIKGKTPIHSEEERLRLVQHIDVVDEAFLGDEELGVYSFFSELKPDIIALGYDQDGLKLDLERFIKKHNYKAKIVTLSIYKEGKTKSSSIKKKLGL